MRNAVLGFQCLDSGGGGVLFIAIDLDDDEVAGMADWERRERFGGRVRWVTHSCDDGVVGAREVSGYEAFTNTYETSRELAQKKFRPSCK
jgi:hypothetical protein